MLAGRRRRFVWFLGALGVVALFGATTATIASADPQTFDFTGEPGGEYTVPAGVCEVTVDAYGGQGGSTPSFNLPSATSTGGLGGRASATIPVSPGQKLNVNVGGQGAPGLGVNGLAGGPGGFNGGGNGGSGGFGEPGAGGGGSSDVRQGAGSGCVRCPAAHELGTGPADRVVVAGGGGGAGGQNIPQIALPVNGDGGAGGGASAGAPNGDGENGDISTDGGTAGEGGGAGGTNQSVGAPGEAVQGGAGGNDTSSSTVGGGGGGGGGGYVGGGGGSGGSGASVSGGGGGGGGSSAVLATEATNVVVQPGVRTGNGQVTITDGAPAVAACAVVAGARLAG